jgi:hypothetical protein
VALYGLYGDGTRPSSPQQDNLQVGKAEAAEPIENLSEKKEDADPPPTDHGVEKGHKTGDAANVDNDKREENPGNGIEPSL